MKKFTPPGGSGRSGNFSLLKCKGVACHVSTCCNSSGQCGLTAHDIAKLEIKEQIMSGKFIFTFKRLSHNENIKMHEEAIAILKYFSNL